MKIKSTSVKRITRSLFFIFAFASVSILTNAQAPVINSFSPASGPLGTTVIISGANFSAIPANNIVYFGAVKANVTSASTGSLSVTVPVGSTYSPITVTVNGKTGTSVLPFIVTFDATGVSFDESSFADPLSFQTVSTPGFPPNPYHVIAADIDGDGKPDIAAHNNNDTSICIFRNNSTPGNIVLDTFRVRTPFWGSNGFTVADLDGDGKKDIVVSSTSTDNFIILQNTSTPGHIGFTSVADSTAGGDVFKIEARDIDGDGKPEIILLVRSAGKISIFPNTSTIGNISFAARIDFATPTLPNCMNVSDLDNDQKTDIITGANGALISIFKNSSSPGNINLAARVDVSSVYTPYDIAVGDIDGDGKPDLSTADLGFAYISMLQNTSTTGNISFGAAFTKLGGNQQEAIEMADLNGDGKPEIITGGYGGLINVFKNVSTPGTISLSYSVIFPSQQTPGIAAVDLDADGKPDLVSGSYLQGSIMVDRNKIREPSISSVSPLSGGAGTTLNITGTNLDDITTVTIGGVAASFSLIDATSMTAVVPNAAFGDSIVVHSVTGYGFFVGFNYTGPQIDSITPRNAGLADTVFIKGNNFTGATVVKFGNTTAASFAVIDPTTIRAILGSGSSGKAYVATPNGFHSFDSLTYYLQPSITAFTPGTAASGQLITIKGNHFFGTTDVQFGNIVAASWNVLNDTTIEAITGSGASGNVTVTTYGGTASKSGFIFTGPVIRYFMPTTGITGDTILIRGDFLLQASAVSFGSVPALSFIVVNDTTIKAVVGAGSSGAIAVTTPTGTTTINNFVFGTGNIVTLCPPSSFAYITSPLSGTTYQWQLFNGTAFADIHDNTQYIGTNTQFLIADIPSSQTGSLYRCKVNGNYTPAFQIKFVNEWVGNTPYWDDSNNWSCGTLPDENTDVIINAGTVIVNTDATIRSLDVSPGVIFTVMSGYTLIITN